MKITEDLENEIQNLICANITTIELTEIQKELLTLPERYEKAQRQMINMLKIIKMLANNEFSEEEKQEILKKNFNA